MFSKKDILTEKREELTRSGRQFDDAVDLVTTTVQRLRDLNADIDANITDIEAYQKDLEATRISLMENRGRTERVIANFERLIEG